MQCAGGCNPLASFKPTSCLPNPVCRSRNMTIQPGDFDNLAIFTPILQYAGDASKAAFTLDSGSLGPGPEGVLLQLKAAQQAKISTTDYLMYGYVEATLRHDARQGVVAAFITMSDVKDEIDWEWTGANSSEAKTNYFYMGEPVLDHGTDVHMTGNNVSDWHTYGLNWTSSQLQWTIDGNVVRTLTRDQAGAEYPRSPARIQFSTWAGGNETNPEGTIDWAGGPIDWTTPEYKKQGFYSQEIKQFAVQCASLSSLNLTSASGGAGGTGGGNVTSFVYTGANSSSTSGPAFGTSTAPLRILSDPGADGIPGYPGFKSASDSSTSDSKDGKASASSSGKDSGKDNGGKGQDGDKSNNDDKDSKASAKDDSANSSSSSTSDALKYALPISGAIVGLAAAWGLVAFVRARHLKAPIINAIGVTGVNDPRFSGPSNRGYLQAATGMHAASFHDLEDDPQTVYRNEPNMNLMMGGGIMSDAGLSHLQRQTTGSSRLTRNSSRTITDRLLRNQSRKYQQLDATTEEEGMEEAARHTLSSVVTSRRHADSNANAAMEYVTHDSRTAEDRHEYAVRESGRPGHGYRGDYDARMPDGGMDSWDPTPVSSPVKAGAMRSSYHQPARGPDSSFEACQLQSPQRRALPVPVTPYTPNYAQAPQRPSGRMYDTPNVNYYPTPVIAPNEGYMAGVAPHFGGEHVYAPVDGAMGGAGYAPTPPPRRHYH